MDVESESGNSAVTEGLDDYFWLDIVLGFVGARTLVSCSAVSRRMRSKVEAETRMYLKNQELREIARITGAGTGGTLRAHYLLQPLQTRAMTTLVAQYSRLRFRPSLNESAFIANAVQLRIPNNLFRCALMAALAFESAEINIRSARRNVLALPPVCEVFSPDNDSMAVLERIANRLRSRGEVAILSSYTDVPCQSEGKLHKELCVVYLISSAQALDSLNEHPSNLRRRLENRLPPNEEGTRTALWGIVSSDFDEKWCESLDYPRGEKEFYTYLGQEDPESSMKKSQFQTVCIQQLVSLGQRAGLAERQYPSTTICS